MAPAPAPDRYEPFPSLVELPRWLWRRTGRMTKVVLAVLLLGAAAVAIPLAADIRETKRRDAEAERAHEARAREQRIRRLRAEQRPRFRRSAAVAPAGAAAAERLAGRAAVMDELGRAILADARRRAHAGRLQGPILRVECEPFPRSVDRFGAERQLSRRQGRYSCVAVTAEFGRTEESIGGLIGHPFRALVDFETGRYAFCKISPQPGPAREQVAPTPRACGGR